MSLYFNCFQVTLSDGRKFSAHVEDIDVESDLATLRVNAVHTFIYCQL